MAATGDPTLAGGLRWLATKRVTLGVVSFLLAAFAVELAVWWAFGPATWESLFVATVEASPAWVLAPFAHRGVAHLLTTVSVIVVYGALVETALPAAAFLTFYVAAGYASTAAQLAASLGGTTSPGTLGASGAALALVALFTTTVLVARVRNPATVTSIELLFAGTGLVIAAVVLANDFVAGVQVARGTAPYGHLGGLLTGLVFGLQVARWRQGGETA
jgi:membrane associated rhomboid family serine protease